MPLHTSSVSRIPLRKSIPSKSSLGPPDVYPQDPNQKEDELNAVHVKQGFTQSYASLVNTNNNNEYGSQITELVTSSKVLADLKSIMSKKEDANTLSDSGRRKQSISRENFWLVTPTVRNKEAVNNWLRELAGNRRSFSALLRKVLSLIT